MWIWWNVAAPVASDGPAAPSSLHDAMRKLPPRPELCSATVCVSRWPAVWSGTGFYSQTSAQVLRFKLMSETLGPGLLPLCTWTFLSAFHTKWCKFWFSICTVYSAKSVFRKISCYLWFKQNLQKHLKQTCNTALWFWFARHGFKCIH